jgi:hypothetical protein
MTILHDMSVRTATERAQAARTEAFDRILSHHLLYCTVLFALISAKRLATRSSASSQPASRKWSPSRIRAR